MNSATSLLPTFKYFIRKSKLEPKPRVIRLGTYEDGNRAIANSMHHLDFFNVLLTLKKWPSAGFSNLLNPNKKSIDAILSNCKELRYAKK